MSRYIDGNVLKANINTAFWTEIEKIIDSAPSIDIVRCKECRYWTNDGMQFDNNLVIAPCKQWLQYTRMNGYCHNGEREGE